MSVLQENHTLKNGVKIPKLAFGTWQIPNGEVTKFCQNNNILVEAYSPLATGAILNNEELKLWLKSIIQVCRRDVSDTYYRKETFLME